MSAHERELLVVLGHMHSDMYFMEMTRENVCMHLDMTFQGNKKTICSPNCDIFLHKKMKQDKSTKAEFASLNFSRNSAQYSLIIITCLVD